MAASDLSACIERNLAGIRARIAEAAARSGRKAEEVTLVAVTKSAGEPAIRALVESGCRILGESRPQQLWERARSLASLPIEWHLIGHLQTNKVRRTLPLIRLLQSCDSPGLIQAVDRCAGEGASPQLFRMSVLIEVNISGETAKHGFAPDAIERYFEGAPQLEHVEVRGLMCMAGLEGDLKAARADFAAMRELRDRLRRNCPEWIRLDELSMGMSGDFEVAVEEGATIVRVGTSLFEGLSGQVERST